MVKNRSTIDIIPQRTLRAVGVTIDQLKHTNTIIQRFDKNEQRPLGKIAIKTRSAEIQDFDESLIINVDKLYNFCKADHGCTKMQPSLRHINTLLNINYEGHRNYNDR